MSVALGRCPAVRLSNDQWAPCVLDSRHDGDHKYGYTWAEASTRYVTAPSHPQPPATAAVSGTPATPQPVRPADVRTEPQGENA